MKVVSNLTEAVYAIWCDEETYIFSNDEIIRKRGAGVKNPTCRPCFSFNVTVQTSAGSETK